MKNKNKTNYNISYKANKDQGILCENSESNKFDQMIWFCIIKPLIEHGCSMEKLHIV